MERPVPPAAVLMPVLMIVLTALFAPASAFSQDCPAEPASGHGALSDLRGNVGGVCRSLPISSPQPMLGGGNATYQQYTVNFTATGPSVTLVFAFPDDLADGSFTNVSMADLTNPGGNLLTNGNFSAGTGRILLHFQPVRVGTGDSSFATTVSRFNQNKQIPCGWHESAVPSFQWQIAEKFVQKRRIHEGG